MARLIQISYRKAVHIDVLIFEENKNGCEVTPRGIITICCTVVVLLLYSFCAFKQQNLSVISSLLHLLDITTLALNNMFMFIIILIQLFGLTAL